MFTALLMSWQEPRQLVERFLMVGSQLRRLFPHWRLGRSYSGFAAALAAHGTTLLAAVVGELRRRMLAIAGSRARCDGWLPLAVDGSRVECPRTAANEQAFGCAGKQRTAPQLSLTVLYHLTLGLPWDFRFGAGIESERSHLSAMLDDLPPKTLLVADAGFIGDDLCRRLAERSLAMLFRVGGNIRLLTELGAACEVRGETVYLWTDKAQHAGRPPLVLRLIILGPPDKRVYLVTNVLDAQQLSVELAAEFYRLRWGVEVFYRSFKQTMRQKTLVSRAPEGCRQELPWGVVGLWMMGLMTLPQRLAAQQEPRRWSPAATRNILRQRLRGDAPPGRSLPQEWAAAVHDSYCRKRPKQARDWPHQKREPPAKSPQFKTAKPTQRRKAQALLKNIEAM